MNALIRMGLARGGSVMLVCAAGVSQAACGGALYAEAGPAPVAGQAVYAAPPADQAIVEVDTVPPDIESYPSFYIDGGPAYYVEGRWYRRGPHGWGYYRHEPPQLERQRAVIAQAPPAQRERARVEQAPRAEPPRQVEERGRGEQPRPAEERERAHVDQAPPAGRPGPGVVEAQPATRGAPHAAPPKKAAPPQKHDEQHDHDHH